MEVVKENKIKENCIYCGMTYLQKQCPVYSKMCSACGKIIHYKAVSKSAQKQRKSQKSPQGNKAVYEIQEEEQLYTWEQKGDSRNFDLVNLNT